MCMVVSFRTSVSSASSAVRRPWCLVSSSTSTELRTFCSCKRICILFTELCSWPEAVTAGPGEPEFNTGGVATGGGFDSEDSLRSRVCTSRVRSRRIFLRLESISGGREAPQASKAADSSSQV